MRKLLLFGARRKQQHAAQAQADQTRPRPGRAAVPAPASASGSDELGEDVWDDDDAPTDLELAQEQYLISMAMATSATEYQHGSGGSGRSDGASLTQHGHGFAVAGAQPLPGAQQTPPGSQLAAKYWRTGSLDYADVVCDGFYECWGDYPEVVDKGEFPALAALKHVQLFEGDLREVILVNRARDQRLCLTEQRAADAIAQRAGAGEGARAQALAQVVADVMGGPAASEDALRRSYRAATAQLTQTCRSPIMPLGALALGTARHRALLFKVLGDALGVSVRVLRGAAAGHGSGGMADEDAAAAFVKVDGRHWRIDLLAVPGQLVLVDGGADSSHLAAAQRPAPVPADHAVLSDQQRWVREQEQLMQQQRQQLQQQQQLQQARQQLQQQQLQHGTPPPVPSGRIGETSNGVASTSQPAASVAASPFGMVSVQRSEAAGRVGRAMPPVDLINLSEEAELSYTRSSVVSQNSGLPSLTLTDSDGGQLPLGASPGQAMGVFGPQQLRGPGTQQQQQQQQQRLQQQQQGIALQQQQLQQPQQQWQGQQQPPQQQAPQQQPLQQAPQQQLWLDDQQPLLHSIQNGPLQQPAPPAAPTDEQQPAASGSGRLLSASQAGEWEIDPREITLGPRIGIGSYGEVYKGTWRGTEVAVKRFLDPNLSPAVLQEFRDEVDLMARLRHPNIVLFMGAVTQPDQLAIVTQFMPRGSLFRLLHRSRADMDGRRRMQIAADIARGMHYLHSCRPAIVHRDLKSPNLLVDRDWTIKVCDFGLSRVKNATFLASKSHGGTPEWMAPEVLRNEQSNEKCDVYSYGVVLYELVTNQEPWGSLDPMQVVGAVGYSGQTLQLPAQADPAISTLVKECMSTNPSERPSFADILERLKTIKHLPVCEPPPTLPGVAATGHAPSGATNAQQWF